VQQNVSICKKSRGDTLII